MPASSDTRPPLRWRLGRVKPGARPTWHVAAVAVALTAVGTAVWSALDQLLPGTGGALASQTALNALIAAAGGGSATALLFVTVGRFKALPWAYVWSLASSLILMVTLGAGASLTGWIAAVAVLAAGASLLGWVIGASAPPPHRAGPRARTAAAAIALVVLAGPSLWLLTAGQGRSAPADAPPPALTVADDPAAPGPFAVETTTYGSGTDERDAYGEDVDLTAAPVDASGLITGWDERREALWGFGIDRLPLGAKVWHPAGEGPFPLVLLVHGNKSNATASEDGFAYLGETLASQGFIAASIDQNFLNTGPLDRSGGLTGAAEARGWLILEHLRLWQEWAGDDASPFAGRVDLDAIGLIGHSRGGEAIATAAYFNGLDHLPEDPSFPLDHDHAINSLMALAPSDGQYLPGGEPITLTDVDYLVLQGARDADVTSFGGLNQYERVTFTGERAAMKAAVHVGDANHGQFNSRWGAHDVGNGLPKHFIDTSALLAAAEQRRVAAVYAGAFLRATLAGDDTDAALLRDHRAAADHLPDTGFVNQYTDSATVWLDAVETTGFSAEEEIGLPLRAGPGDDRVSSLTWAAGEEATISADLADAPAGHLVFDAATTTDVATDAISVHLSDTAGTTASITLDEYGPPASGLDGQYLKAGWMQAGADTEPVPQTYTLDPAVFAEAEPALDLDALASVTLAFAGDGGTVLVDDIGIAPQ